MVISQEHAASGFIARLRSDGTYPVPTDGTFEIGGDNDFLGADDLRCIGGELIETNPGKFEHLRDYTIAFLWKREGGKTNGKRVFGKCQKPGGLLRHFAPFDFVIWLAADHCRDMRMGLFQIKALLFHELLHAGVNEETRMPAIWPHDFEGFRAEMEEYGAWRPDLESAARAFQQLSLFPAASIVERGGATGDGS